MRVLLFVVAVVLAAGCGSDKERKACLQRCIDKLELQKHRLEIDPPPPGDAAEVVHKLREEVERSHKESEECAAACEKL